MHFSGFIDLSPLVFVVLAAEDEIPASAGEVDMVW
jgi:hypothetical protein